MSKHIWLHGRRACSCWRDILPHLERDLAAAGYIKRDLSGLITQGAYGTSVAASAGTHSGGGVWDVRHNLVNSDAKRAIWLKWGVVPFDRITADAPVTRWANHGHMVIAGCPHLAASAARQVTSARNGRNGLVNNASFRGFNGRPKIITFREALAREAQRTPTFEEELDAMKPETEKKLRQIVRDEVYNRKWKEYPAAGVPKKRPLATLAHAIFSIRRDVRNLAAEVKAMRDGK